MLCDEDDGRAMIRMIKTIVPVFGPASAELIQSGGSRAVAISQNYLQLVLVY